MFTAFIMACLAGNASSCSYAIVDVQGAETEIACMSAAESMTSESLGYPKGKPMIIRALCSKRAEA